MKSPRANKSSLGRKKANRTRRRIDTSTNRVAKSKQPKASHAARRRKSRFSTSRCMWRFRLLTLRYSVRTCINPSSSTVRFLPTKRALVRPRWFHWETILCDDCWRDALANAPATRARTEEAKVVLHPTVTWTSHWRIMSWHYSSMWSSCNCRM